MRTLLFVLGLALAFEISAPAFAAPAKRAVKTPAPQSVVVAPSPSRPSSNAHSGDVGLGVVFGEPTGLTLKSWTGPTTAFDIGLTYSFSRFVEVLADYLWHFPRLMDRLVVGGVPEVIPYVGVGGAAFFDTSGDTGPIRRGERRSNAGFGIRVPVGAEFLPHQVPLGLFAELAPGMTLAPGVRVFLEGGLGLRLYF
jgi:hypothetical protein